MSLNRKIFKFKNYNSISKFLKKYNLKSFNNYKKVKEYSNFFELDKIIFQLRIDKNSQTKLPEHIRDVKKNISIIDFDIKDLSRLHWLALKKKALNILEFGSGFSTVIFADVINNPQMY